MDILLGVKQELRANRRKEKAVCKGLPFASKVSKTTKMLLTRRIVFRAKGEGGAEGIKTVQNM